MTPDSPSRGGAPKKDSIFASILPAPAPAPAPAPVPVPEITALKQKIDALEGNILAQLEKKLGAQLKPAAAQPAPLAAHSLPSATQSLPAAAPGPANSDALCRKIEDLERRLADFGLAASLSASQLKNIEESKISARREIEDLLKAVREQQKYSEMDRQMHDQLEKSWARAAELEKKLMEFYSSVLAMEAKRRDESSARSEKSAAAIEDLAERLGGLEDKLSALAARQPDAGDVKRAREEFLARAAADGRAAAAAQEAAASGFLASLKQNEQAFKEVFGDCVREQMELLHGRVAAESEAVRREMTAALEETSRLMSGQAALAAQKAEEFEKLAQAGLLRAQAAGAALEADARLRAQELETAARLRERELEASARALEAGLKDKSAGDAAAAQEISSREFLAAMREQAESFKEFFGGCVRGELELLRGKVSAETEALRREAAAAAEETRKAMLAQAELAAQKAEEFEKLAQAGLLKAQAAGAALEADARRRAQELEQTALALENGLKAGSGELFAAAKKDSEERFDRFGAKYADALLSAGVMDGFRSDLDSVLERLAFTEAQMSGLLKDVQPEKLDRLIGVSGMLVRKKFEALAAALETLKAESKRLGELKRGVEERFKDIFGNRV
ncbi:MAG: hypothetical protein A2X35_07865 [Elusimicrobia bacterium GWA2_61_42]|nr:MAG: hypothetical protein A2X35_07865 [Elusimicrobia bacterium GWA2_61_42]OGR76012.1 MAG: hypothetical protein A2X38_08175 [Elusimicrobia bacterium GWC2_61_25]